MAIADSMCAILLQRAMTMRRVNRFRCGCCSDHRIVVGTLYGMVPDSRLGSGLRWPLTQRDRTDCSQRWRGWSREPHSTYSIAGGGGPPRQCAAARCGPAVLGHTNGPRLSALWRGWSPLACRPAVLGQSLRRSQCRCGSPGCSNRPVRTAREHRRLCGARARGPQCTHGRSRLE